jgi:hypothetical protein
MFITDQVLRYHQGQALRMGVQHPQWETEATQKGEEQMDGLNYLR